MSEIEKQAAEPDAAPAAAASPAAADPAAENRTYLAGAFVIAFCVIFLEIVLFQMLLYVSHYLHAQNIISIALLGIALGGLAAFYLARRGSFGMMAGFGLAFPLCMAGSFIAVAVFSSDVLDYAYFLMLPFACGSVALSVTFSRAHSNRVYFADLAGAALGVLAASVSVSLLREEGALIAVLGLSLIAPVLYALRLPKGRKRLTILILAAVLLAGDATALGLHLGPDLLNMGRVFSARRSAGGKVFRRIKRKSAQPARLVHSASSLVARIDVITYRQKGRSKVWKVAENGDIIDSLRRAPAARYQQDPRIAPQELIADPDTLIIGSSVEGVLKPVRSLGSGEVTAVEINPAILSLALDEVWERSGRAYENVNWRIIDGRSFLAETDRKFDYITLMNAHFTKGRRKGKLADPEYLHTYEAYNSYLDHLTDRGAILIEERIHGRKVNEYMILKSLYTLFAVMRDRGIERPQDHLYLYDWTGSGRTSLFLQIIIKKQPFTAEEVAILDDYLVSVEKRTKPTVILTKMRLIYSPFRKTQNLYADFIRSGDKENYRDDLLLFVTTDNRPFPFHVFTENDALKKMLGRVSLLALAIFAPMTLIFLLRHRERMASKVPSIVYFATLGVGYLLLEIVFMQRFQHFLGNPVYSLVVILGSMLFFTGLGSYMTRGLGRRGVALSVLAVIALLGLDVLLLERFVDGLIRLPLAAKFALAVLAMAPVSFFMGAPFPYGLNVTKANFTGEYAALMFGLNGVFCALGTPLSMILSTAYGFTATFLAGMACYGLALICLVALKPGNNAPAA